jgi:hypothetical protein
MNPALEKLRFGPVVRAVIFHADDLRLELLKQFHSILTMPFCIATVTA